MSKNKISDEAIISAYEEMQNVWRVGERVGMSGQCVHKRLKKLGKINAHGPFSDAEREILKAEYNSYAENGIKAELCAKLGRHIIQVTREASRLGLTRNGRKHGQLAKEKLKLSAKTLWARHPHPKGMLGKVHTSDTKKRLSATTCARWLFMSEDAKEDIIMKGMQTKVANGTSVPRRSGTSWKAGIRNIGGKDKYYRSRWEANYARYLEWLKKWGHIEDWQHEPETFWFEGVKRGNVSYLPDFKVTEKNGNIVYHEVKGWMDDGSKTKIKRMAKYHPHIKLLVIDSAAYRILARKMASIIQEWEHDTKPSMRVTVQSLRGED